MFIFLMILHLVSALMHGFEIKYVSDTSHLYRKLLQSDWKWKETERDGQVVKGRFSHPVLTEHCDSWSSKAAGRQNGDFRRL